MPPHMDDLLALAQCSVLDEHMQRQLGRLMASGSNFKEIFPTMFDIHEQPYMEEKTEVLGSVHRASDPVSPNFDERCV